jgi:osmotically-inducible protein OsmY
MEKLIRNLTLGLITIVTLSGCAGAVIVGGTAASAAHDRRTLGSFVEDQNIELKAGGAISNNEELNKNTHINVTSYNGIVLLTGEAPTPAMRGKAEDIVKKIEKVRRVHNEITIASPSALGSRTSDTWITTKVKTSLLNIKTHEGFDPTRVKVVTENGTVFLMGLIRRSEANDVVDVVRKVKGVQRVVKVFEYID